MDVRLLFPKSEHFKTFSVITIGITRTQSNLVLYKGIMTDPESNKSTSETVPAQPSLQTERLILRPFFMSDAAAVFEIVDNESVASMTRSITLPYSLAMAEAWIEPQAKNWSAQSAAVFAMCWRGKKLEGVSPQELQVIGAIGLQISEEDEKGELGYWISETFWGHGIATEAASAMVKFGFEMLCLNKIFASHMVKNPASGRVMEKIGMSKEGISRDHVKKWGQFEDAVFYGILARDNPQISP